VRFTRPYFDHEGGFTRLLLDNTGLHRVHVVLSTSAEQTIPLSDALALLHFAEHIMFSEGMIVSAFERPGIRDISAEAIARLASHGCTSLSGGRTLLTSEDFSDSEYSVACHNAAFSIQEDLQLLDTATIRRAARLANELVWPLGGVDKPPLEKWLAHAWSQEERRDLVDESLQRKALGAYDFIVASHEPIYRLMQGLAGTARSTEKLHSLAMLLDVVFRVTINEQLSGLRGCTYAPAPQRAKVTQKTDHLFRHALERMIHEKASENGQVIPSGLVRRIMAAEQLPLPVFALHFLAAREPSSPLEVLDVARELRDSPDVVALRKWLAKWETVYNSADLSSQEKALRELRRLRRSLDIAEEPFGLFDIVRLATITGDPVGGVGIAPDPVGLAGLMAKLLAGFSRRRVFLALLTKRLALDQGLGALICKIVGRPIFPNS
jgi:hypothetical protein